MPNNPHQSPAAVEDAFYAAFARLDLILMSAIWIDGKQAVCIHPGGGLLRGKDAVLASWRDIFGGAQPPQVDHRLIATYESDDLAVRLVEERIRPRGSASEQASRVIATNVYVRRRDAWYLAEHHASLPMVEQKATPMEERKLH
jgi:ketosteroid isomerase-like protein